MVLKTVEQQIWEAAVNHPEREAVISGKERISYKQLCSSIIAARDKYINELAIKPSSTILLAAGKQVGFAYAYFGAHLAGIKVVPLDAQTNPDRLQYIIEATSASLLIGFEGVETDVREIKLSEFETKDAALETPEFPSLDTIADILFTTGTTGAPKGVSLTHSNEAAAARNINTFIGNTSDDKELLALPISHSFGLGRLRCCLSIGATIILLGNFANVKKLFRVMGEEQVTGFTMVPASWRYLHKFSGDKLAEYYDQLKYIELGSAFLSAEEKQEIADLLPNTRVCMHYGLTEASRSTFMEFHEDKEYLSSVGKASPFTDIQIFDDKGNIVPPGEEGEICVKGEHVTNGYLNIPRQDAFFGEHFRTGDWGRITDNGYIFLASRKKDLINVGGKKVSPDEVEMQIMKVPGVSDCACIATPDPEGVLGEVVKAFVVKDEEIEIDFETIRKQIEPRLEYYKLPVVWEWISEIPKTQNGKTRRNLLS